jgi:hypothetical protein
MGWLRGIEQAPCSPRTMRALPLFGQVSRVELWGDSPASEHYKKYEP